MDPKGSENVIMLKACVVCFIKNHILMLVILHGLELTKGHISAYRFCARDAFAISDLLLPQDLGNLKDILIIL